MRQKNKLMILAVIAITALQMSCVKIGHNYPDDGLPLGGTVWKATWSSTSPNGGPLNEMWILYFEVGNTVRRHYEAADDNETVSDDMNGTYEYKSPDGRFIINKVEAKFVVNGNQMYVNNSPLTYYCIQGRD